MPRTMRIVGRRRGSWPASTSGSRSRRRPSSDGPVEVIVVPRADWARFFRELAKRVSLEAAFAGYGGPETRFRLMLRSDADLTLALSSRRMSMLAKLSSSNASSSLIGSNNSWASRFRIPRTAPMNQ
jgi:hypothetical protein